MDWTTIIGFAAAFCTTAAFAPQAIKAYKTRDTGSLSLGMYCLFVTGISLWLAYGLLIGNWPIIAANLVTVVLAGTVLALKLKHG